MKACTKAEIIAAINHSYSPIILVEGKDDKMIYRWILETLGYEDKIISTSGCSILREIYKEKDKLTNKKVIFITDKDMYVYSDIPKEYDGIIFTKGYSIENDLFHGKSFLTFFKDKDTERFNKALKSFLNYYACELEKFRNNTEYNIDLSPFKILEHKDESFKLLINKLQSYRHPNHDTIDYLRNNYDLLIRGHSLFALFLMILSFKGRIPKYGEEQIYEMCYSSYKSQAIKDLETTIKERYLKL